MPEQMVVIVTGANRGIGLEICKQILRIPHGKPLTLFAASRAGVDLRLSPPKDSKILYPNLDITSASSIASLASEIEEHYGQVDVVINNAGINTSPKHTPQSARQTLETNYRGTLHMCQSFMPFLAPKGRIVNVSSVGSSLGIYSKAVQSRFRNPAMTLQELEDLAKEYEVVVERGREKEEGFGGRGQAYSVSKACVNALTGILAREDQKSGGDRRVNCCCPGWVDTDMGELVGKPTKSVEDGAKIPMRLAFGEIGNANGIYWANPSISGKGEGQVMEW